MRISLLQANSLYIPLKSKSVDLICTSPPYFSLRDYGVEGQLGLEKTPTCGMHGYVKLRKNLTEDQQARVVQWLRGEERHDV